MAAPVVGMQDVPEGKDYSFPKEARRPAVSSPLIPLSTSHRLQPPCAHRVRCPPCPHQEEKVLAFWDEIDAFKTQLKLTEGLPECVSSPALPWCTALRRR
jgi:hypothetical protein